MDLSSWMETGAPSLAPTPQWIDASAPGPEELADLPRAGWIRMERCVSPQAATELMAELDVVGVYLLKIGANRTLEYCALWVPNADPPEDDNELLVAVRVCVGVDQMDFLQRDVTWGWIEQVFPEIEPLAVASAAKVSQGVGGGEARVIQLQMPSEVMEAEPIEESFASSKEEVLEELALRLPKGGDASLGAVVWTKELPRLYGERWENESVRSLLPYLWFEGPGAPLFRLRYRALVSELLQKNFLGPVAEWCEERRVRLVLHCGDQDSLSGQTLDGWGSTMPLYACAGRSAVREPGSAKSAFLAIRQAVSVAEQLGLGVTLAELFDGRDGRCDTLGDFRASAERVLALGASCLVVPPVAESMRGDGKRVAGPAAPVFAQSWMSEWEAMESSLERLGRVLRQGRRLCDVLVLVPSDSVQTLALTPLPASIGSDLPKDESEDQAARIDQQFMQMLRALQGFQIDFDLADEDLIAQHGRAQANTFWIGERGEYTTVLIPPALSWRMSTMKKLRKYVRKGGSVIAPRPVAAMVDFAPSKMMEELEDNYANFFFVERPNRDVCFQMRRIAPAPFAVKVSGKESTPLLVQHRRTESHEMFLVANTSRKKVQESRVSLGADGAARVLDPWGPQSMLKDTDDEKGVHAFNFNFHPGTATLFSVGGEADLTEAQHQRRPHATSTEAMDAQWDFERLDPNLLPLLDCQVFVDGDLPVAFQSRGNRTRPIEFVRTAMRDEAIFAVDAESEVERVRVVKMSFSFDVQFLTGERRLDLFLEKNPDLKAWLNREALELESLDEDDFAPGVPADNYICAEIEPLTRGGENLLEIEFSIADSEGERSVIESPILSGDFGVGLDEKGKVSLIEEASTLRNGPWSQQGYPFYAGRMRYRQEFLPDIEDRKRYFIRLEAPRGAAVRARVGDHKFAQMAWPPHRMEITRLARSAEFNMLEVEVAANWANVHGPIHTIDRLGRDPRAGAEVYDSVPSNDRRYYSRTPVLMPFGLTGGAFLETYDPDAPPPKKSKKKKETEPDESSVETDELSAEAGESNPEESAGCE